MGKIVESINTVSNALSGVSNIHANAHYLAHSIPRKKRGHNGQVKLTMQCPVKVQVGEGVSITGTAPPGLLELYSNTKLEREIYPESNGNWGTRLFFAKQGHYVLYARIQGNEVKCEVNATE